MLALLIGLLVAAGPLLRGAWDPWAQSFFFCAVSAGAGLWLASRLLIGYLPLPPRRLALWAAILAVLAGVSAVLSPVACYAVPSWRAAALGLWIFPAITLVSKDERALIDEGIRAAAWVLVLLAFYQRYHDHIGRPPSALLNENVFAGAILLLLPVAFAKSDWLLAAGLCACLWWCHSVGAWLGVAGALLLMRHSTGPFGYWLGALIAACGAIAVFGKLQAPEAAHRLAWWAAAGRMVLARPLFGFGVGSFAYVVSAYQSPGVGLSTLFSHQHFLETAAERGLPYLAIWIGGLIGPLRRGGAHKRFGALALLIQSFWDYSLSIPALFWLFCYFAASSSPHQARAVNVPARAKIPACVAALAGALALAGWSCRLWRADILKARGAELLAAGDSGDRAALALERSADLAADPETERLAAEADLRRLGETPEGLKSAAVHFFKAARLNPYRASHWAALAQLSRRLGDEKSARLWLADGARFCPSLRGAAP